MVRLGLELGVNAARWGQALSILGGVLGLIGTYAIAWAVTGRHALHWCARSSARPPDIIYSSAAGKAMTCWGPDFRFWA